MSEKVKGLKVNFEPGTAHKTAIANWTHSKVKRKAKGTDTSKKSTKGNRDRRSGYSYRWYYQPIGSSTWLLTNSGTVSTSETNLPTLSVPDNAHKIKIGVKISSKKYKDSNKKEHYYFTSDWEYASFDVTENVRPEKPTDIVEASLNQERTRIRLHAHVDLPESGNNKPKRVQFGIWRLSDSDDKKANTGSPNYSKANTTKWFTVDSNGDCNWSFKCYNGSGYSFCARCRDEDKNMSIWTPWSHNAYDGYFVTKPTTPNINSLTLKDYTDSSNIIFVSRSKSFYGVSKYYLEVATNPDYMGTDQRLSLEEYSNEDTIMYAAERAYSQLYFRLQAENASGLSDWSSIHHINLGLRPGIPTAWTSKNNIIDGEPITFYWNHNALDNSSERRAVIRLEYDDDDDDHSIQEIQYTDPADPDPDHEFDTRSYVLPAEDSEDPEITVFYKPIPFKWAVMTHGAYGIGDEKINGWSDWSMQRQVNIYARPTVNAVLEDYKHETATHIEAYPFYISGSAGPTPQNMLDAYIDIIANEEYVITKPDGSDLAVHKDDVVYSTHIFGSEDNTFSLEIGAGDIVLENNISYTIKISASMDSGLVATEEIEFDTQFKQDPYTLDIAVGAGEEDAALIDYDGGITASIMPYAITQYVIRKASEFSIDELASYTELGYYYETFYENGQLYDWKFTYIASNIGTVTEIILEPESGDPYIKVDMGSENVINVHEFRGCSISDFTVGSSVGVIEETNEEERVYIALLPTDGEWNKIVSLNTSIEITTDPEEIMDNDWYVVETDDGFISYSIAENPLEDWRETIPYFAYYGESLPTDTNVLASEEELPDPSLYSTGSQVYILPQASDDVVATTKEIDLVDGVTTWVTVEPETDDYINVSDDRDDIHIDVYRKEYDGKLTLIEKDILSQEAMNVVDPHPNLNYVQYRLVGRSEDGLMVVADIPPIEVGIKSIVIQWDEDEISYMSINDISDGDEAQNVGWMGSMLKLPYNIDISYNNSRDIATVEYQGREHPVSYYGTQLGETATWSTEIPKYDAETLFKIRRLAVYQGDCYVREPSGSGYWATVDVTYNVNHNELTIPISFNITRVEGGK